MAQVTSNTQIDTINILTEASSANDTDMFLLQRGSTSYKIPKNKLILPSSQIANIGSKTVLGNIGGSSAAPSEIQIETSSEGLGSTDDTLATSGAIKGYVEEYIEEYVDEAIDNIDTIGVGQSYTYVSTSGKGSPLHNTSDRSWFAFIQLEDNEEVYYRSSPSSSWVTIWGTTSDRGPASLILPPNSQCSTDRSKSIFVLK
jgi:hypothetical protein